MLFSSISFLFYFLPAIILLYYIVPFKFKNTVLLAFSLFFYAWGGVKYAGLMIIAIILTPDALGKKIPSLKKIIDVKEVNLAGELVMFELLYLGVPLGISAGKNIMQVIEAGPALVLQEFGNLGTMIIALPLALALGMRREAVGATISICREPTMGLIGEH